MARIDRPRTYRSRLLDYPSVNVFVFFREQHSSVFDTKKSHLFESGTKQLHYFDLLNCSSQPRKNRTRHVWLYDIVLSIFCGMGDSCKTHKNAKLFFSGDFIFLEFHDSFLFVFLLIAIFSFRYVKHKSSQT